MDEIPWNNGNNSIEQMFYCQDRFVRERDSGKPVKGYGKKGFPD